MINWFKNRFSEKTLIRKVQNGDKDAFGKLYVTYLDRIYRYVFFRVNQDKPIAEDVTESVFLKALQHIEKFEQEKGTFQAWLYRIAHNTVLDHYKAYKTTSKVEEETVSVESIEAIEEAIDTQQKMETVRNAMKTLTDEQQEILTLRFIEGLTPKEISYIVNKHEDAVRAAQYRGLQMLKKMLNK